MSDRKSKFAEKQPLTRRAIKAFRKSQGWSATEFACELGGLSRSYIKHLEGGSARISPRFAKRFEQLRARVRGEQVNAKQIVMRGRFPKRLVIVGKPKRCPGCNWHFVGVVPNQKYCSPSCRQTVGR